MSIQRDRIDGVIELLDERAAAAAEDWPEPIDLQELAEREPEPPPMIINDWLPCGYATMLAGHGGAGKSGVALQLAVAMAMGGYWCGLPVEQRRVLYLSCEDRQRVLHWRLQRICDHTGACMADLVGRLDMLDLVGRDTILYGRVTGGMCGVTTAYDELARRIESTGAEVLVVDGVNDTFGGNENDRADVKRYVNSLVRLITEDRGAVFLVAHVNKASALSGPTSEGYSGSTAWHNAVRARWYLRPETEKDDDGERRTGDLLLELQKSNFGSTDRAIRWSWSADSRLLVGMVESDSVFDARQRDTEERDGILAALRSVVDGGDYCPAAASGSRTAYHVLKATDEFPKTLRSGGAAKKRFWRHIEALRHKGDIAEGSIRRANRHITATLVPKGAADMACVTASHASETTPFDPTQGAPAPHASHAQGGYRGARARTQCQKCGGEGCDWCRRALGSEHRGDLSGAPTRQAIGDQ